MSKTLNTSTIEPVTIRIQSTAIPVRRERDRMNKLVLVKKSTNFNVLGSRVTYSDMTGIEGTKIDDKNSQDDQEVETAAKKKNLLSFLNKIESNNPKSKFVEKTEFV